MEKEPCTCTHSILGFPHSFYSKQAYIYKHTKVKEVGGKTSVRCANCMHFSFNLHLPIFFLFQHSTFTW